MCTSHCVRPGAAGLPPAALAALADLYAHPAVRLLAGAFSDAGGQLFLVGGPVRDALTGCSGFADLDFTTNLRPAQIRRAVRPLGPIWAAGERFGTIGVQVSTPAGADKVEVTTFRKDVYTADSRKPQVGFGDDVSTDLARRDLTVNAIALDTVTGCLIDPFNGRADLAARILRTPDDPVVTLTEDPLRILRLLRFSGRLGAAISDELADAARTCGHRLAIVSAERKLAELDKLDELGPGRAAAALANAGHLGVLGQWIPGADTGPGRDTLLGRLGDCLSTAERLAVLLGHDRAALPGRLRALTASTALTRGVSTLLDTAAELSGPVPARPVLRGLLRTRDDDVLAAAARVRAVLDGVDSRVYTACVAVRDAEPHVRDRLPVTGDDLLAAGLTGRAVGAALRACEQHVRAYGQLDRAGALALASDGR